MWGFYADITQSQEDLCLEQHNALIINFWPTGSPGRKKKKKKGKKVKVEHLFDYVKGDR